MGVVKVGRAGGQVFSLKVICSCYRTEVSQNGLAEVSAFPLVYWALQLIIIEGSYCCSADELAIGLQDLGRKGRARVRGGAKVSAKGHFVVGVSRDIVPEHNPVKLSQFSDVADVCGIPYHYCLRQLAGGHVDVFARTRAHKSFKLEAVIRALANTCAAFCGLNSASTCGCIPQRLAATGNMVQSLCGGSQPP